MSRHDLPAQDGHSITVGWDQPLQSYFVIVKSITTGHTVKWAGTGYQELPTLDDLVRAVQPYEIPYEVLGTLYDDRDEGRMN